MCICFYTTSHAQYSLVLITNRDEFVARSALPAAFHGKENATLSGIDVQAGGTWCGVEKKFGRFGILTNVREEVTAFKAGQKSRGRLVSDWLDYDNPVHVTAYLDILRQSMGDYAGFNLLLGRIISAGGEAGQQAAIELGFLSNRSNHNEQASQTSSAFIPTDISGADRGESIAGCFPACLACPQYAVSQDEASYGVLSNGALACGGPSILGERLVSAWPKMRIGQDAFRKIMDCNAHVASQDEFLSDLFGVLDISYPDLQDKEDVRSSVLVTPFDIMPPKKAWYATRAQTIMLVKRANPAIVTFVERQAFQLSEDGSSVRRNPELRQWTFEV